MSAVRGDVIAPVVRDGIALGQNIFIYNNIRTNQVIYSLRRTPKTNAALRQLPFLGKKSRPATIRKDSWLPMACVTFPQPYQGLLAYQKLREFRKRHEFEYPPDILKNDKRWPKLSTRKRKSRILMDQKANTVADLAATLRIQEEEALGLRSRKGAESSTKSGWPKIESVEGVSIDWTNEEDATYAESWPAGITHNALGKNRYQGLPLGRAISVEVHPEVRAQVRKARRTRAAQEAESQKAQAEVSARATAAEKVKDTTQPDGLIGRLKGLFNT